MSKAHSKLKEKPLRTIDTTQYLSLFSETYLNTMQNNTIIITYNCMICMWTDKECVHGYRISLAGHLTKLEVQLCRKGNARVAISSFQSHQYGTSKQIS